MVNSDARVSSSLGLNLANQILGLRPVDSCICCPNWPRFFDLRAAVPIAKNVVWNGKSRPENLGLACKTRTMIVCETRFVLPLPQPNHYAGLSRLILTPICEGHGIRRSEGLAWTVKTECACIQVFCRIVACQFPRPAEPVEIVGWNQNRMLAYKGSLVSRFGSLWVPRRAYQRKYFQCLALQWHIKIPADTELQKLSATSLWTPDPVIRELRTLPLNLDSGGFKVAGTGPWWA